MKHILGVMLAYAVSMPAYSKAIAYMENQSGGRIVLTDQPGCKIQHMAYAIDSNGEAHDGCWVHDNNNVYIKWLDVDTVLPYDIKLWRKMEAGQ